MKSKGFTLIELMIVLAIVGIVATMIVPRFFGGDIESARRPSNGQVASGMSCQGGKLYTIEGSKATPVMSGDKQLGC